MAPPQKPSQGTWLLTPWGSGCTALENLGCKEGGAPRDTPPIRTIEKRGGILGC